MSSTHTVATVATPFTLARVTKRNTRFVSFSAETRLRSGKPAVAPSPACETLREEVARIADALSQEEEALPSRNTRHKDYPLYDYESIPAWLRGNSSIQSYYRCGYTTAKCFKSIFAIHNETVNIWTHLLGFVIVFALAVHVMFHMELGRKRDYLIFSLLELGSLSMLGGSALYHTLAAHHSSAVHNCALGIDYIGITLMIIGSFYPPVFYLFSCSKEIRFSYCCVVTTLGLVTLFGPAIWPHFTSERFYHVRLLLFCSTAVIGGLLPGLHVLYALPTNEYTTPVYHGMLLSLSIYFVGMLFYLFKAPECFFPGKFDLMLSSHQLWHFFVLSAAVVQYFTSIAAFQLWRVTGDAGGECV